MSEKFELLVEQIRSPDEEIRKLAIAALSEIEDQRTVDLLLRLVAERSQLWEALAALRKLAHPSAAEPLRELILIENDYVGREAAHAFLASGGQPKDANEAVRIALLTEDHKIALPFGKDAVEPLMEALPRPEPGITQTAVKALGEIGDPRAVDKLITLLHDWDPSATIVALGKIADPRAIVPLIALLESLRDQESVPEVRVGAAKLAITVIAHLLEHDAEIVPDEALNSLDTMADIELTELIVAPRGEAMANEHRSFDLSHLRRLASMELELRGAG